MWQKFLNFVLWFCHYYDVFNIQVGYFWIASRFFSLSLRKSGYSFSLKVQHCRPSCRWFCPFRYQVCLQSQWIFSSGVTGKQFTLVFVLCSWQHIAMEDLAESWSIISLSEMEDSGFILPKAQRTNEFISGKIPYHSGSKYGCSGKTI